MEFEVLKKSHLKRNILIGVLIVGVFCTVVLNLTRAKYRVTESIPLVTGTINYKVSDFNLVSLYIANEEGEYVEADTIPTSGYILNTEQSYCGISNNGEIVKDDNVILTYENGNMTFSNVTKKGTKCYLYFDEVASVSDTLLANYPTLLTRTDFSTTVTNTTTGTIYYEDTSKGRTYYFAGNPTDNWVRFGGFYWRIIRINEDGTIRLIYQGTSANTTGEGTQIGTSEFNVNYDDNAYVGYMYGTLGSSTYDATHANTNNSAIKQTLDEWYSNTSGLTSYSQYIDGNAGFCGDREPSTSDTTSNGSGGTGTTETYYGAYIRLYTNKAPMFECTNESDLYTTSGSEDGNRALTYPIGLITADEVAYAGGVNGSTNQSYYLYTNQDYWTMSPMYCYEWLAHVFNVNSNGNLGYNWVPPAYGIRPVINFKADVTISSGNGTTTDPYQVEGA